MTRDFKDMFLGWGIAEETGEMAALVHDLRANERDLQVEWRKIEPEFAADCLWHMVASGVDEARAWREAAQPLEESAPTLVSYIDSIQPHKSEWSTLLRSVLLGERGADELVSLHLRTLLEAQANLANRLMGSSVTA